MVGGIIGRGLTLFDPPIELLSDVVVTSVANGDILVYQASTNTWINQSTGTLSNIAYTNQANVFTNLQTFNHSVNFPFGSFIKAEGITVIDPADTDLIDTNGFDSLNWGARQLLAPTGSVVLDYNVGQLYDSSSFLAYDIFNRKHYFTNGSTSAINHTGGGADSSSILSFDSTHAYYSQILSLATGKDYRINNVSMLTSTALGSTVVNSSLTKVGLSTLGFVLTDASGNLSSEALTIALPYNTAVTSSGTIILDAYVPFACTVTTIRQIQCNSGGTCTANFKINTTSITGLSAISVTSTPQDVSASALNTVASGNSLNVTISAPSSLTQLIFTLVATRTA